MDTCRLTRARLTCAQFARSSQWKQRYVRIDYFIRNETERWDNRNVKTRCRDSDLLSILSVRSLKRIALSAVCILEIRSTSWRWPTMSPQINLDLRWTVWESRSTDTHSNSSSSVTRKRNFTPKSLTYMLKALPFNAGMNSGIAVRKATFSWKKPDKSLRSRAPSLRILVSSDVFARWELFVFVERRPIFKNHE